MEDQDGGGLFAVNIDGTNFRKLLMTIKEAKTGQKPTSHLVWSNESVMKAMI
jgi:hypothetical protein